MCTTTHLLRRNIKSHSSKIHFLVRVNARNDEEDARTLGSSLDQAPQPEYDCSLIFLDYLQSQLRRLVWAVTISPSHTGRGRRAQWPAPGGGRGQLAAGSTGWVLLHHLLGRYGLLFDIIGNCQADGLFRIFENKLFVC